MYFIGLDAGSVSIKAVVLDENGNKLEGFYVRHYGHPLAAALNLLKEMHGKYPQCSLSVTGSSAKTISSVLSVVQYNEIVAQSYSIKKLYPHIKTVIELGGEDSKLIILENGSIKDFSMNSVCAAGTGSFLEQQAERLRLGIEQFSEIASVSKRPSKIAGRCSVFAKSDMIHLQQIATPVEDIVAGLCFAVARNFKGTIAKGREIKNPVAFQGGVAANKGMVRAFKEIFELDELFVPPDFALMGAMGAALKAIDEGVVNSFDLSLLESFISSSKFSGDVHKPLVSGQDDFFVRHIKDSQASNIEHQAAHHALQIGAYLGIDIGSISTNLAVIDEHGTLLAKRYLMTAGRPIEAVKQGLSEIYDEVGAYVDIKGVGTTGSGRYMIADYVGADIVKNEITAQATAAIYIDPKVDTIFEIGGQDSKYISIRDGIIVDFEMNKACAAGTGSFIEEQAEKLNISVKGEFAECSFNSGSPCRLGERCTVFMENSLMANLQRGAKKDDLLAGLAYSIVQNYINRVVAGRYVGDNIFFQGGVAFNKAVVAAFEKYTGRTVTVPPNHDVTGAIGMALIARDIMKGGESCSSKFKGFEMSTKPYEISSFECKGCANVCEINRVKVEGEEGLLFYGGRCEKYDVRKSQKSEFPDLFAFREEMLWKTHNKYSEKFKGNIDEFKGLKIQNPKVKIGIPNIFSFHDYLPLWSTFLWELGFEVIVSPKTNKQVITLGVENVISEACFPIKVAHGHIKYLFEAGVDAVFVPSFINVNMGEDEFERGLACPHVQTIPYVAGAAMRGIKMISPIIDMAEGKKRFVNSLLNAFKEFGIKRNKIEQALKNAELEQAAFVSSVRNKGAEVLSQIKSESSSPVVAIIGRAYNAFDSGMNLEIPKKLSHIHALSIPMDMLPLKDAALSDAWPNMYWRSGQKILKAARIIRNTPNLYAICIGNFSCGPDSFIFKYFKEEMADKPFLHIEIDEHSADAGAVTRCEAFLDSIQQQGRRSEVQKIGSLEAKEKNNGLPRFRASALKKRVVYIPRMAEHALALQAAFEYCGVRAETLAVSDKDSVDIARRYVSGKECYPYIVTAGDMLKKAFSSDFKQEEAAFFMPSGEGPCRFGQYNVAHSLILQKAGFENVPIFAPNQDVEFYRDLGVVGNDFSIRSWQGITAYELLTKCLHETRPYEKERGDSDSLHMAYSRRIYETVKGKNGHMPGVLREMKDDFASVAVRKEKRPLIGIVGEIFVRSHEFSNEGLIRKVENLGGEAWLAPIEEWIYYVNEMSFRKALIKKDGSAMMNIFVKKHFQKRVEHKYGKIFRDFLNTLKEPETADILKKAAPYVHDSFEGETVLSVGKAIDLIQRGAAGIICAMPFGCMPGTIVTALMKAVSKDYGVPCISIPYDGSESTSTGLQLEAFMEAARNGSNA
jgi:predicted CoA-substrate-specific enzyme activase